MAARLQFAGSVIDVEEGTLTEAGAWRRLEPFRAQSTSAPSRWGLVRASSALGEWSPIVQQGRTLDAYRVVESGVELHPDIRSDGAFMVLRTLFSLAIEAAQGVLVHASCVAVSGKAALVTGVSGAGKSTIARWAEAAGATILSDEVVGILPDGRVLGTPFFSDADLVGTSQEARLALVATLIHDSAERFVDGSASAAVQVLASQVFHRQPPLSGRAVLNCLASAVAGVRTGTFACRNAAAAGTALVGLIA